MKYQGAVRLDYYLRDQNMPQRPFFLGGIPSGEPGRYILLGNGIFAIVADRGQAVLQHLGIVIIQNLDNIPERADQQHLIQMGRLTAAVVPVPVATFPHRVIVGGGMPILPTVTVSAVGTEDLVGE